MRSVLCVAALLLQGCTTSVKHLSDPRIEGDGYTLVCGGLEYRKQVTVAVDACHNLEPTGGELVFIEVKYHWRKHKKGD